MMQNFCATPTEILRFFYVKISNYNKLLQYVVPTKNTNYQLYMSCGLRDDDCVTANDENMQ